MLSYCSLLVYLLLFVCFSRLYLFLLPGNLARWMPRNYSAHWQNIRFHKDLFGPNQGEESWIARRACQLANWCTSFANSNSMVVWNACDSVNGMDVQTAILAPVAYFDMILSPHGENVGDNGLSRKLAQQGSQFRALAALKCWCWGWCDVDSAATALVLLDGGGWYGGEDLSPSSATPSRPGHFSHPFTVHILRFRMFSRYSMNQIWVGCGWLDWFVCLECARWSGFNWKQWQLARTGL